MSYSRYKMLRKLLNGIPQDVFTQGDLIQVGPFDTYEECQEGNASPDVTPDTPDMQYRWVTSNEPWCEGWNEYKTEKQQQSPDNVVWTDTGATRRGEFVQSHSFNCGYVAERWVNISGEFVCENGDKYAKQKKQTSTDGVTWFDSGDTRKGSLIEVDSADCGYPQYRWVEIPLDVDYECVGDSKYYKEKEQITQDGITWSDTGRTRRGRGAEVHSVDCGYIPPSSITRWVDVPNEYVCEGTDKYQKQKQQISYDSGETWRDTSNVRAGSLIESQSYDCGYVAYRWVTDPSNYVCQGYDKYAQEIEESSTDGETWTPTGSTRTGALIERNSYDCDYVLYRWVTASGEYVCSGTDKYTKEKEQSTTDGTNWVNTGRERAGELIEIDSPDCTAPSPVNDYLTFTSLEDGNTFQFTRGNHVSGRIQYSLDNGSTWTNIAYDSNIGKYNTPVVNSNESIKFKGNFTSDHSAYTSGIGTFSSTKRFNVSGCPDSTIYGDEYGKESTGWMSRVFENLFQNCIYLVNASELLLSATTLGQYCYQYMFSGCTSLRTTPVLPATTLANYCYQYMFDGCTSLTTTPNLPVTTLANYCYSYMFNGCTSLTSIPVLPATAMTNGCYKGMFSGCTSLAAVPNLPATTLATYCYSYMFNGCTGLTNIPNNYLPVTALATYCYSHMFNGCTGLTNIPSGLLPATTLASYCYEYMFAHCTGLTSIPNGLLPATTLAEYCYYYMFDDCTGLTTLPSGLLPATTLSRSCYSNMFYKCMSLRLVPSDLLPATTLAEYCYYYMFYQCTSLAKAPDLLATTLANYCYQHMFQGCDDLKYIKMMHHGTGSSGTSYFNYWVQYVKSGGTFVKYACTTWDTATSSNLYKVIPSGWDVISEGGSTQERWITVSDTYVCNNGNKYQKQIKQVSDECGSNWTDVEPLEVRAGELIEAESSDCTPAHSFDYLTFTSLEDGNAFAFEKTGLEYSLDNGSTWTSLEAKTYTPVINRGESIKFRGNMTPSTSSSSKGIGTFNSVKRFSASGCPDSLLFGVDYGKTSLTGKSYAFYGLFSGCYKLTSIDGLSLPATTLASYCYEYMFSNCTGLTSIPSGLLPATTLAQHCYGRMFNDCTGLTSIPTGLLPATTLASWCYSSMFHGCSALTTVPSGLLPATTLSRSCYSNMFNSCKDLTTVPSGLLPATTLASFCYEGMFQDCISLRTAPDLPATTLATYCYYYMFQDCTSLTTAPELPATTLAENCYKQMFQNGSSLNYIKCLATNISATDCLYYWVDGVQTNSGTFVKTCTQFPIGDSGIPYNWTVVDEGCSVEERWTTISGTYICDNGSKYQLQKKEVQNNDVWVDSNPLETRTGSLIESGSADCNFDEKYLTFEILSGSGTFVQDGSYNAPYTYEMYYRKNGGEWSTLNRNQTLNVVTGDKIELRNESILHLGTVTYNPFHFTCTVPFMVYGQLEDWASRMYFLEETKYEYVYDSMFWGTDKLIDARNLCFYRAGNDEIGAAWCMDMFRGCTSLLYPPSDLPFLRWKRDGINYSGIFYGMFYGCTSLRSVDYTIPYADDSFFSNRGCYESMFEGCTSLTTTPVLPATTLAEYCYRNMFEGCTALTTVPNLPATTMEEECYSGMFYGCTGLTSVPSNLLPATTLANGCYSYMFYDCTGLTNVPILPATTLRQYSYSHMFCGCAGLTTLPNNMFYATTANSYSCTYMFQGCISLRTAPVLPATTLGACCYQSMFEGCHSLTTLPNNMLPATTLETSCYKEIFKFCTDLTTVPSNLLPATTLASSCYSYMFYQCTSLTTAPDLLATTLTERRCYEFMFQNCNRLRYIKMLADYISNTSDALYSWVNVPQKNGTFVKAPCITIERGTSGIPENWTIVNEDGSTEERWVDLSGETVCVGSNKCQKQKKQISYDCGSNWTDAIPLEVRAGEVIESNSWDCIPAPQSDDYLTFTSLEDGNAFAFEKTGLEYSLDNGSTWTSLKAQTNTPVINRGESIRFRGNMTPSTSSSGIGHFYSNRKFKVSGCPNSLIFGDYYGKTDLTGYNYAFQELFFHCLLLVDASELSLSATTLSEGCYKYMFRNCSFLVTVPSALPATTLANNCYESMFEGCTSLTTAPVLPATTLATSCYYKMFYGCTSLTTAPVLPATIMSYMCYLRMFYGCTSLVTAPELPATTLAENCYSEMFSGCTSLTTAPVLPAATLASYCYGHMFSGCTSLTTAPVLSATTLAYYCYSEMFIGCTNLNYIKMLATDISASGCLYHWVNGVSNSGTFYKAAGVTIPTGISGIPSGWTVETATS